METQPRVNAKLMNQFVGQNVLLVGEVVESGERNVVRACDGGEVVVNLQPGQALER